MLNVFKKIWSFSKEEQANDLISVFPLEYSIGIDSISFFKVTILDINFPRSNFTIFPSSQ